MVAVAAAACECRVAVWRLLLHVMGAKIDPPPAKLGRQREVMMNTSTKTRLPLRTVIRWMIRRDIPQVLNAEHECYTNGWTEDDFLRCLRQCNCIGMVSVVGEEVVGYMLYELNRSEIRLLNLAVIPAYRRQNVGRQMVAKLIAKLSSNQRTHLTLDVRESNLDAQLFFRELGFKAVKVARAYYEDTGEDAYLMAYRFAGASRQETSDTINRVVNYR
jgi:ribosomal-protein-alanine N-acetyltransferase